MPRATIADSVAALLIEHRALGAPELGRLIAARGLTRAKQPTRAVTRALDGDRRFRRLSDGRWTVPGQLLRGVTLTHRLSATEAAAEVLALTPDLAPLVALAPEGLWLPDGQPFTVLWDADAREASGTDTDAALHGPPGWLANTSPGDLVHVRLTGSLLHVGPGPEPPAASRLAARRMVAATRARLAEQEAGGVLSLPPAVSLEGLVLDLLADDPGLAEHPLPPLGEAFAAAGLEVHRGFVGSPGTDWPSVDAFFSFEADELDAPGDWLDDAAAANDVDRTLRDVFGLAPEEVEGLEIVLGAYELSQQLGGFEGTDTHARLAAMFAWPGIVRMLALKAWSDAALEPFVADVARAASGADAAGPRFVLAACAEARDDVMAAERLFRSALDADADHPLALVEMARYKTDRGDYGAALDHLRAAGVAVDDSERAWLEGLVRPGAPKVGRNERCPCGSGRKYKVCHRDEPDQIGPVEPARALLHKLDAWLSQPNMQRIGEEILRQVEDSMPPGSHAAASADPMLSDIVLFDRGGLRRFLDVRGALLPAAERALGMSWLLSRRSLHEVAAVQPGTSLALRDLRVDGKAIELVDRSLSEQVRPLDLLCLRLLPDGLDRFLATDGVLVPRPQRRRILDLLEADDGIGLLRWIMAPAAMPRLSNAEGEPLMLIRLTYELPDPSAAAGALRDTLRDDGEGRFIETVVRRGQEWIRGSITLDGERATIEANSRKRAARLERTLRRSAPGARLIGRDQRAVEQAMAEAPNQPPAHEPIDLAAHPELLHAMDAFIRQAEASWVDEQIPALGGLTPRQAVADASARHELEALLDDMAWQRDRAGQGIGLMDPGRVRALLGIGHPRG